MPSAEQSADDRLYVGLHTLDQAEDGAYAAVRHAESVFRSGLGVANLFARPDGPCEEIARLRETGVSA